MRSIRKYDLNRDIGDNMPDNKQMKIQWITINGRQVPLVLPQTYSYADDDWKVTSDRDPLPVVEYGTTEGGVIVPKRVSDEGHELTQLTGSNVEHILFDALVLTDTSRVRSQDINISNLSKFYLFVKSTIDVEVRLGLRIKTNKDESGTSAVMFWEGEKYENTYPSAETGLPISNTSGGWILLNTRYNWLSNVIANSLAIQLMATEAPTAGSISVHLVGRA